MKPQDKDKFICEKLGVYWHDVKIIDGKHVCGCGQIGGHLFESCKLNNPDFTSEAGIIQLLKLMEKRKDYFDFINTVGRAVPQFSTVACFISIGYITDNKGKCRDAVYKWLGGEE